MKRFFKYFCIVLTIILICSLYSGCEKKWAPPPHTHSWKLSREVKGTCTTKGVNIYYCTCGETDEVETDYFHPGSEFVRNDHTYCWKEYTCECESPEKQEHDLVDGICKTCGYSSLELALNNSALLTTFCSENSWTLSMTVFDDPSYRASNLYRYIRVSNGISHERSNFGSGQIEAYIIKENNSYIAYKGSEENGWIKIDEKNISPYTTVFEELGLFNEQLTIESFSNNAYTVVSGSGYFTITVFNGLIMTVFNNYENAICAFTYNEEVKIVLPDFEANLI